MDPMGLWVLNEEIGFYMFLGVPSVGGDLSHNKNHETRSNRVVFTDTSPSMVINESGVQHRNIFRLGSLDIHTIILV